MPNGPGADISGAAEPTGHGGVDLEAITGTIDQWRADDAAMEAAERAERAREEWYLTHPCVAVQAMPEVRSRTFQTQITGEVREVFRDINGAIVTKPPPSPPVPDPPTPPTADSATDATASAAGGDAEGASDTAADVDDRFSNTGSRRSTPPPAARDSGGKPRVLSVQVADGVCQTVEAWPTAAVEARHAAIDDAAAAVAEQVSPAAEAPPQLPAALVDSTPSVHSASQRC